MTVLSTEYEQIMPLIVQFLQNIAVSSSACIWDDNHFPSPACHAIPDTGQDAVGLLGHLGTLLAHIQPAVDQYPHVRQFFPKPVMLHGVVVTQVQDLALGFVKRHTTGLSSSIQPVQIPL
ncbi:hypothetical protein llap_13089 [Limosa lapponica baueri]|uniref:Uncharacterized protein n=1 Tax=Limosa lapponica baueri TaxID=1758121 RepID=A0A2I0TS93_LIMLA|nr:hypothetical protein llap_13089 [Limosa lapponica baueri]